MRIHELLALGRQEVLPYALIKMQSPRYRHCWLPISREYSRLGCVGWTDYDMCINDALVFVRDPRTFENVWATTTENACFLYSSTNEASADYQERLERLLAEYHFFHGDPPPELHFAPLVAHH
ncbi:hypothetical protein [Bradyrhizobium brasilense]|uniref:Uncharacterized protein n=1 Tax=Bradyrhizobium brasilense TaxID=1419277 RepID=A0ABY8JMA3_9BRAD|nr:hypothetical protein [Bradyrhizobium brasilense]WFU64842.1 hypothetical protein QA636_04640 [Bradyrhizobium brasilense]